MSFLKKNFFNAFIILLSIILALTPTVIAPVCPIMENGMKMGCYYSKIFVLYLAIAMIIISLISIFINNRIVKIILNIINIICALFVHLVPQQIVKISVGLTKMGKPKYIGHCMKSTMNCVKHHTFTITSTLGIIIALLSIGYVVYLLMKKES
ncbi:hypothetical protein HMPREF3188_01261 [Tissierellia bacterium KA00581]|jgi:hypothetical protein|nr:hypothetical protein HMPREF3188_01261 [Tissierellia bacterium KA00581]